MIASHSTTTTATTTVLLGLTAAVSLLLFSATTSALPASIPYASLLLTSNNKDNSHPYSSQEDTKQQEHQQYHDSILFGSKEFFVTRPTVVAQQEHLPLTPPPANHNNNQRHDLEVSTFSESIRGHQGTNTMKQQPYYYSAQSRDQILDHCTTHFRALLDAEISDRLVAQLSRLVMMLPVIGVETRAVMRTKVLQVMEQIVSTSGLTKYETLHKVIKTAVDDAALLVSSPPQEITLSSRTVFDRIQGGTRSTGPRRQVFSDDIEQDDRSSDAVVEDIDGNEVIDYNSSLNNDALEEEEGDSVWFRLPSSLTRNSRSPSRVNKDDETSSSSSSSMNDFASQIPAVTEVAMEAVLDYMAEILTPTLVIHQLTEAIQEALQQISKQQQVRGQLVDFNGQINLDINTLSNQNAARDHHSLDLLSDDWIWSSSSSSSPTIGSFALEEDEEETDVSDSRGEDEDLWDQDMELHPWDTTGRLFEDFEGESDDSLDSNSKNQKDTATKSDNDGVIASGSDEVDEDEYPDPFVIGIQDPSGHRGYDDEDDDDEDIESFGDYPRQTFLSRFQKRSLDIDRSDDVATEVKEEQDEIQEDDESPTSVFDKRSRDSRKSDSVFLSRRRPDFAPDPRLENLLTQLIEPMLTTFIDEDFPASCKRVQGELMDGIVWSMDQSESSSLQESNDLDQLVLLAELEY
ncbi:hypothetical protein BGZ83_000522 [Gryganskiella cystojenkinii]|nr:hypothetical protein BGZ83_000522 [Gryganskiella cystojenkinii]